MDDVIKELWLSDYGTHLTNLFIGSMQMTSVLYRTHGLAFRKCWIFAITMELNGIFYLIQLRATLSLLEVVLLKHPYD